MEESQYSAIEKIFHSKKIKYVDLNDLQLKTKKSGVNIIIDFYWILGQLANDYVSEVIDETPPSVLCALMYNLLAHYRAYFAKNHDAEVFFYIAYSFDSPKGITKDFGYKEDRVKKLKECSPNIREFAKQFRMTSKYFDDIFVINMKSNDTDSFIESFYKFSLLRPDVKARSTYVISNSFLFQASALQTYKVLDIRNNSKFFVYSSIYDESFKAEHVNAKKFELIHSVILPEGLNNIDQYQYYVLYAEVFGDSKYNIPKAVTSIKQVTEQLVQDMQETEFFLNYSHADENFVNDMGLQIVKAENNPKLDTKSLRELNKEMFSELFVNKNILNESLFDYDE